jgi:hypothetical protein
MLHDVRITKHQSSMATVIQCVRCPEKDTEAEYEWHDTDGTVYYVGSDIPSLVRFLEVHPTVGSEGLTTPPF